MCFFTSSNKQPLISCTPLSLRQNFSSGKIRVWRQFLREQLPTGVFLVLEALTFDLRNIPAFVKVLQQLSTSDKYLIK